MDLASDPNNCGQCGFHCRTDECGHQAGCLQGTCQEPQGTCSVTSGGGGATGTSGSTGGGGSSGGCGASCSSGADCQANEVCYAGRCGACPAPYLICDGTCVTSDASHCGRCGNACGPFQACVDGRCACKALDDGCGAGCACRPGQTRCGATCSDLGDHENCGACGQACGANQACVSGRCSPLVSPARALYEVVALPGEERATDRAAVADVDGDGLPDLLLGRGANASSAGEVLVLPGLAGGGLGTPLITTSLDAEQLATADLDGDGHVDVVVASLNAQAIRIGWGEGSGRFAPDAPLETGVESFIAVADVDGDGRPDIFALEDAKVCVFHNAGSRSFTRQCQPAPTLGLGLELGDFDEDGRVDLATDGSLLLGNGDGTFRSGAALPAGRVVAVGRFHPGGHLDVVLDAPPSDVPYCAASKLRVLPGDGAGHLGAAQEVLIPSDPQRGHAARATGGPLDDLVFTAPTGAPPMFQLWVARNDGAGNLAVDPLAYDVNSYFIAGVGDLNADGRDDLLVTGFGAALVRSR